jgi:hypothetical protein
LPVAARSRDIATMTSQALPMPSRPTMLNPVVDFLAVGGLSLLVFLPLLLTGQTALLVAGAGIQAFVGSVINMPHFMASYRIVYRSKEMILKHKWATIFVPTIMVVYLAIAIVESQRDPWMLIIFGWVASGYLAWHYTGQAWGMMASYSHLAGRPFDGTERMLIRGSLRILLAFHVAWAAVGALRDPSPVMPFYRILGWASVGGFVLGAYGLWRSWRRTGALPATNALVAWLAIFAWYAVMGREPKALFWVQIAHAVQYLVFPVRVEINRTEGEVAAAQRKEGARPWWRSVWAHMALYAVILLAVSFAITAGVPLASMAIIGRMFGEEATRSAPILLLLFINIHHYFTDGVIWKISNPEVRKELFAHVPKDAIPRGAASAREKGARAR